MPVDETKYFFSYARDDSDFVLKLAKELRAVGANLWLDQLDIVGGQRWDRAVEEALATCQSMIVVLSPKSVASNNVMDEVSYALEENKLVVPVLHKECDIPFRLRRVQRIDFTADYDTGFVNLLRALGIEQISPSPAPVEAEAEEVEQDEPAVEASEAGALSEVLDPAAAEAEAPEVVAVQQEPAAVEEPAADTVDEAAPKVAPRRTTLAVGRRLLAYKWYGVIGLVVLLGVAAWASGWPWGESRQPGIYLKADGAPGDLVTIDMVTIVPLEPESGPVEDRPYIFEKHLKDLCLAKPVSKDSVLTWNNVGVCQ